MNCIGLDIGTSSICVCAVNTENGETVESLTFTNSFDVEGAEYERRQNASGIIEKCIEEVDLFIKKHSPVCCIGITGQMHGIVYVDKNCNPVSDLFTWQDMTADEKNETSVSYAKELTDITGYAVSAGFGSATYFSHNKKHLVPQEAVKICTIHDLAAAKLAGLNEPVMHSSDAQSFGLFDSINKCFDKTAIKKAGLDDSFFPEVINDAVIIGYHNGIPVCCAIGDNQASFIGSVKDAGNSVLINFGTGSQISFMTSQNDIKNIDNTEIRPYHQRNSLFVGSALCGGKAFSVLEEFIRSVLNLTDCSYDSAYVFIDRMLEKTEEPCNPLKVTTTFSGTRSNPAKKGNIENIGTANFTAQHLIYGVLHGMT
ncbi:MAG: hypothetical protein IK085_06300, partial [Clostridia bacterium]|nr:hypothetical protein [Clostridia bacterium]